MRNMNEEPFEGDTAVIARLLAERGFQLGRGQYHHANGDVLPTVVISRPDAPGWRGAWMPWEIEPETEGDVAGEAQAAFEIAGIAMYRWERDAYMFSDEDPTVE